MKTHRLVIGIVLIVVLAMNGPSADGKEPASQPASRPTSQPTSQPAEYRSKANKFSILPPESWTQQKPGGKMADMMFLCPEGRHSENFRESITILVEKLRKDTTPDANAKAAEKATAAMFKDYKQVSLTDVDLGNVKAKRLISTYSAGERKSQMAQYFIVKDKMAYVIICMTTQESFEKFEKTFDDCARTFRVE